MEEVKEEKGWFADKIEKIKKFCEEHPDVVLTLAGGAASLLGGALKLYAAKTDYTDSVYMTDGNDVYKLPAKQMQSKKLTTIK